MKLYVGNLNYQCTEEELKALFEAFGEVDSAQIVLDRNSGRSKGFGFVEMPDQEQARAALDGLNGTEQDGRTIVVNEAHSKPQHQGRRGDYGGGRVAVIRG